MSPTLAESTFSLPPPLLLFFPIPTTEGAYLSPPPSFFPPPVFSFPLPPVLGLLSYPVLGLLGGLRLTALVVPFPLPLVAFPPFFCGLAGLPPLRLENSEEQEDPRRRREAESAVLPPPPPPPLGRFVEGGGDSDERGDRGERDGERPRGCFDEEGATAGGAREEGRGLTEKEEVEGLTAGGAYLEDVEVGGGGERERRRSREAEGLGGYGFEEAEGP